MVYTIGIVIVIWLDTVIVIVRYCSTDIYQTMKMNQLDLKICVYINKWKRLEKSSQHCCLKHIRKEYSHISIIC